MNRVVCLFFNGLVLLGPLPARALEPIEAAQVVAQSASADRKEVNFGPYMAYMQKVIKANWKPPRTKRELSTKVSYTLLSTGQIQNVRIVRRSGSTTVDTAALKAISRSSPLMQLPNGAPSAVEVEFTFDYHPKQN